MWYYQSKIFDLHRVDILSPFYPCCGLLKGRGVRQSASLLGQYYQSNFRLHTATTRLTLPEVNSTTNMQCEFTWSQRTFLIDTRKNRDGLGYMARS